MTQAQADSPAEVLIRRIVEGQVQDFLNSHPTAVTLYWRAQIDGKPRIVASLTKRIVGDLAAHLEVRAQPDTPKVLRRKPTRKES